MDEFARMMSMEGVRPLDRPEGRSRQAPRHQPAAAGSREPAQPVAAPAGHAWATGAAARTALETALHRLATELRDGRRGWATGVRQDGTTATLPATAGAAALLGAADRESLRLMLVGGDGWTFVMHPTMGVATLDEDPGRIA